MTPRRWLIVLLVGTVWFAACRTTRPEAGLPARTFDGPMPQVVSNDRGLWFLVSDPDVAMTQWVVIGDEAPELHFAVQRGQRTAQLMPATPFAYPSLDARRGKTAPVRWVSTPGEAKVPDTVGYHPGQPGAPLSWTTQAPPEGTRLALVNLGEDGIPSIRGIGILQGGRLTSTELSEGSRGPYLVLPDGPALAEHTFRVGNVTSKEWRVEGVTITDVAAELPEAAPSRFLLQPAATRLGVHALVTYGPTGSVVVTSAEPVVHEGLALAITEDPFEVPTERVPQAIRGLKALDAGHYLTAVFHLAHANVTSSGSELAGRLRGLEPLAVAGYVDWIRAAALGPAEGLDADVALYLARAHFLSGDYERADDFASRAIDRFSYWGAPRGTLGAARARLLRARLAARNSEWDTAFDEAIVASEAYATAGDAMRAAEAELLAATFALHGMNAKRALKAATLARSRFFHGGSEFWSGFAEIALADIYRRIGEVREAEKMARFAALRFEELGDPVARNRARIAEGRVRAESIPAQGLREIRIGLERATQSGDRVGAVDASSSLVVLGSRGPDEVGVLGLALLRGLDRVDDPLLRSRASQALALLCGTEGFVERLAKARGSAAEVSSAQAACEVNAAAPSAVALSALLTQGWNALAAGELDEARSVLEQAQGASTEETRLNAPLQAAEVFFLSSAVDRAGAVGQGEQALTSGLQLLASSVDPTRLAQTEADFARRFAGRGQIALAADLLRAAMAVAGEQKQTELRRELALERVELLHSAADWDAARDAIRDAEPILETAGAAGAALLARLWAYDADVLERLGRTADAGIARQKAEKAASETEGVQRVSLALFEARLALDRGDLDDARTLLGRAQSLEASLPRPLSEDLERKLVSARLQTLRGELAEAAGDRPAAHAAYTGAVTALAEVPVDAGTLEIQTRALAGAGRTATSDEAVAGVIRELERHRAYAGEKAPAMASDILAALIQLEISAGRPSRAQELVQRGMADGTVTAGSPAACLEARAAALSEASGGLEKLRRCIAIAREPQRFEAQLLEALLDPKNSGSEKQRRARELASENPASARTRERLALVSELYLGATKPDARREEKLRNAVESTTRSGDATRAIRAVRDLAEYLVDTGRPGDAVIVLEQNSNTFYDNGAAGPGMMARLRAEAMVAALEPLAAFNFAERAVSETPDMTAEDQALTLFAAAKNAALLGMWQHARSLLFDAQVRALDAKNRRLASRIQDFAKRFELPLTD